MPNPGMSEQTKREALRLVEKYGTVSAASRAENIPVETLRHRVNKAKAAGLHLSLEGGKFSVPHDHNVKGVSVLLDQEGNIKGQWVKTQAANDMGEDTLERIKEAFCDLPAAEPIPAPAHKAKDLLTLYPIADAHIGMLAWGAETGEDYDTKKATSRLVNWLGQAVESSPPSETAVILDVGDLTHADDQTNQTPRSKHVLDVDTRHFRTIDVTISALVTATKLALRRHKRVIVRILPGNHNVTSYMAVLFALAEHFRNEPRVDVQKEPGEFFAHRFGANMICAHHGDKAKAERMVLFLADEYPEMWGATRHRFLWTGHLHHHKSADIGGVKHEQLRALTARDAYAASNAYCARAQLQAVTYHHDKGEVGRVSVNG